MDTALVIVLLAMAAGVGLCLGYLIGHSASFTDAVYQRRYRPLWESGYKPDDPDDPENRESDNAIGVRFHR